MRKNIYALILTFASLFAWAQNFDGLLYGNARPSELSSNSFNKTVESCDQIVPIPDDLTNGTYLGGNTGNRVAVDVTIDEGTTMTINEIKVSLAKAGDITFADFKFLSDVDGLPGEELFDITDTEIIAEDTLTYINIELGHLRNFTIKLNTPVVLNGSENTKYWMEVVSDARAWGSNPYAEQAIGKGLAMRGTNFEWFELQGIESLYEIHATCDDGSTGGNCSQGNESNGFEDGYSFASINPYILADDFIVEEGTTLNVQRIKMNVLSMLETIGNVTLNFRSDNAGVPGDVLQSFTDITPTSEVAIGEAFGVFTVYEVTLDLPSDLELTEGTYWLQPSSNVNSSDWEVTSEGTIGGSARISENGGAWQTIGYDTVFEISGECATMGTDDLTNSDFNYYPNPVKNSLTIHAEKNIKSVEIYNMAGQTVLTQKINANNSTFNTSSLPAGIYIVKAILENGQVETFKIIKK